MRELAHAERIKQLLERLGQRSTGPGRIYVTGGTTAVLLGWRDSTKDIDLKLDPEPPGAFEAIRDLKEELSVNVELAAPDQFLPPVPGWRQRSEHIMRSGPVDFYHYDLIAQALAKIERSHEQDLRDVEMMLQSGRVTAEEIRHAFRQIEAELIRYPAIDPDALRDKVEAVLDELSRRAPR